MASDFLMFGFLLLYCFDTSTLKSVVELTAICIFAITARLIIEYTSAEIIVQLAGILNWRLYLATILSEYIIISRLRGTQKLIQLLTT